MSKQFEDIFCNQNKHWTGNDVIDAIVGMDKSKRVYFANPSEGVHDSRKYPVNSFFSWRGSYDKPSISSDGSDVHIASDFISIIEEFFCSTQTGWKGGSFSMDASDKLWCDPEGSCAYNGVSDVVECDDAIYIVINHFEY